jgi:hypothetical protein
MTTTPRGTEPAAGTPAPPTKARPDRPRGRSRPRHPAGRPAPAVQPTTSGLLQLVKLLGSIVAPTTLLTSLLIYFGWSHAFWFFDYFGVNSSLLGLTTQDYLRKSMDGLFVPMLVIAGAALVVLWGHALLRTRLAAGSHPRILRVLVPAMAAGGLVLAGAGVWSVFGTTPLDDHLVTAPLSLAIGVLLLVDAVHLWRLLVAAEQPAAAGPAWVAVAEWAGVFVLVGLSLFWAANDYSAAVGSARARQFVAELPTYPTAVLYSERSLNLGAPGVREVRCEGRDAAFRFRYDGLKLMQQSGDQYLFVPEAWSRDDGVAILVARNDSLRLELVPASARGVLRRSC